MTARTPVREGYKDAGRDAAGFRLVSFVCSICKETKLIKKTKSVKKKYSYCSTCYQKSPERIVTAHKIVASRPDFTGSANPNFRNRPKAMTCLCGNEFIRPVLECEKGTNKHKYCSVDCRAKFSVSIAKFIDYKGMKMRSSWEVRIAEELDRRGLEWSYEPQVFWTPFGYYTPDFYLPSWGAYLEVKGSFRDQNSRDKFDWFSSQWWIHLVDKNALEGFGYNLTHSSIFVRKGQYVKRPTKHRCPRMEDLIAPTQREGLAG